MATFDYQQFIKMARKWLLMYQIKQMQHFHNMKFFIVDDDPFCRSLYHQHLVNLGYRNNMVFDNGADCINKLDMSPDVIFLDYDMAPFNGLQVLQYVKKVRPEIQLLIISSRDESELVDDAMRYGAYAFIPKGENDLEMISNVIQSLSLGHS